MRKIVTSSLLVLFVAGCGGSLSESEARDQVTQLITLYQDNQAKFVVQKQQIVQDKSCSRATALRKAIDKMAASAAMNPADTKEITVVQMELTQAEKGCLAK
jgi:hypothetical protein